MAPTWNVTINYQTNKQKSELFSLVSGNASCVGYPYPGTDPFKKDKDFSTEWLSVAHLRRVLAFFHRAWRWGIDLWSGCSTKHDLVGSVSCSRKGRGGEGLK